MVKMRRFKEFLLEEQNIKIINKYFLETFFSGDLDLTFEYQSKSFKSKIIPFFKKRYLLDKNNNYTILSKKIINRGGRWLSQPSSQILLVVLGRKYLPLSLLDTGTLGYVSESETILLSLYFHKEKVKETEFNLSNLLRLRSDIEFFNLTKEELVPILIGLSAKHPSFINVSFTHDLEKISLYNKGILDVAQLYK